ncbi:hypothetical protein LT21_05230 [Klebsiella pneumoniae]|nr:hypothetical protein LT21_05230 [Klebsiella pneumoniae]
MIGVRTVHTENGTMMSSKNVVMSTKKPVAGYLDLEMIPDREVGLSDI